MKKWITAVLAALLALCLAACGGGGGTTTGVERTIGPSGQFREAEIRRAMDLVEKQFEKGFVSCRLLTLTYQEEDSQKTAASWAQQYGADEAIVLESSFYVEGDRNPSLNPNSVYRGWQWILTRSAGGTWTLQTWGY